MLLCFLLHDMFVESQTTTEQDCNKYSTNPSACPAGCYFIQPNNCTQCPVGTQNAMEGGTCHRCGRKLYGNTPGLVTCHHCPQGHYCRGGSDKTPCPLGRYGRYDKT